MDFMHTQIPIKLLLNAESFGFGPSAAIADFFPYLRKMFTHIGYVGSGHSLDLQQSFAYDEIIDLSTKDPSCFDAILDGYDLFFTALDFDKAKRAVEKNIPTIVYDPLTWFWQELPQVTKEVLYIAQNFHGVKERMENEAHCFRDYAQVSPLVKKASKKEKSNIVMLNMGGLVNPFFGDREYYHYANGMIQSVKEALPPSSKLHILCSSQVAALLPDENIHTLNRGEIMELLPKVKIAIQTPGLANIYDAAAFHIPTLFLPPANDSQGQQLDLLQKHAQIDAFIDWNQLPPYKKIHYKDEQPKVLKEISHQIRFLENKQTKDALTNLLKNGFETLNSTANLSLPLLLDQYGFDGALQVAECVRQKALQLYTKKASNNV